ncbi:hypothetical protein DOTSEDRAFT_40843 [Dothistroma septosporum NZE10]|uniref:Mediator of RNA polymerase II transcription subunit 13 n=1 Tax=Dothistroma septosporum (strain NZE10 / CBS 128990) TaxID=675120 RepID=N1Q4S8_DOTSN|nr:hypothetical protein DOTSEDRAFT_40843 [Dothistroma septosporum NZE10]
MDFLKGCTTNVHAVDNVVGTSYAQYSWRDDQVGVAERLSHVRATVTHLRERNVLCTCTAEDIWVFGQLGDVDKHRLNAVHEALVVAETGTLQNEPANALSSTRTTKDLFLDAIEHAIAYKLARHPNFVHVGPWTWLYTQTELDDDFGTESSVISISTKWSDSGSLYLVPRLFPSSWQPLKDAVADGATSLILAPMGCLARTVLHDAETTTSSGAWNDQVLAALTPENIHLSAGCDWQTVEIVDDSSETVFAWPSHLCLTHRASKAYYSHAFDGKANWRSWFAGAAVHSTFMNPFALAESWFNGASERQRLALHPGSPATQMEELDELPVSSAPADSADANNMSSPFNQGQFDRQTAMTGIYPTPPDGLAQGLANVQTNLATTPSVTNAENVANTNDLVPTNDDLTREAEQPAAADHDDYQMGPEDLFGDVGEIGFGENDVGDADFSFFDEPDDDTMAADEADVTFAAGTQPERLLDHDAVATGETTMVACSSPDILSYDQRLATDTLQSLVDVTDGSLVPVTEEAPQTPVTCPFRGPYEKPLSPFGIRERLLPPPVPASMAQMDGKREGQQRRNSTFQPVDFRTGFDLSSKYALAGAHDGKKHSDSAGPKAPSIGLPFTRKKSRVSGIDRDASGLNAEDDIESEDDSFESSSSESDDELPPRLPWNSRKRKRATSANATNADLGTEMIRLEDFPYDTFSDGQANQTLSSILESRTVGPNSMNLVSTLRIPLDEAQAQRRDLHDGRTSQVNEDILPSMAEGYDFSKDDLICVAQIVSEHSATAFRDVNSAQDEPALCMNGSLKRSVETVLGETLPDSNIHDLGQVALNREPPPRAMPNNGKGPQGQPRPPQRSESTMIGPDFFPLPAPYVKVQRGSDGFEMLPTSLPFWEPLGLAPTSGSKDVQAFCLFPDNADLQRAVRRFMHDIGTAYEGCKHGSHMHVRTGDAKIEIDSYEDGLAPVTLDDDISIFGAFKAYAVTCAQLGKVLASIGHHESERAIVIYMLNPFAGHQALHHLCACFWVLFKTYRENLSKAQRNHSGSDVVLQIVPIHLVASVNTMVVLTSKQAMTIAREVYDRCPPSATLLAGGDSAALPILSAPSIELASAAPKRIGFQLAAEPPSHLLHEGSVLHLAYACSKDWQWVTAAWGDNTGLYQSSVTYSLRGKSLAEVAEEVWERTYEILAARKVTWRLFIVTHQGLDQSMSQCWRSLSKPRAQPLCVTLSSVQLDPVLVADSPASPEAQLKDNSQDGGFLTPASTPQGNNFTSSPDVSGQSNAPATPAPSDTPASALEMETETHLVDVTDETWGVLISPNFSSLIVDVGLANALIFKRGEAAAASSDGSRRSLPGMGVTLHWTIQVKPNGAIDEGSVKQAELTLRELVKMYRNLALLTKAKGLDRGKAVCAPLPVAAAMLGAEGLDGFLPAIQR